MIVRDQRWMAHRPAGLSDTSDSCRRQEADRRSLAASGVFSDQLTSVEGPIQRLIARCNGFVPLSGRKEVVELVPSAVEVAASEEEFRVSAGEPAAPIPQAAFLVILSSRSGARDRPREPVRDRHKRHRPRCPSKPTRSGRSWAGSLGMTSRSPHRLSVSAAERWRSRTRACERTVRRRVRLTILTGNHCTRSRLATPTKSHRPSCA
jgi:hypothetical protein